MRDEPMWSNSCSKRPESARRPRGWRLAMLSCLLVCSLCSAGTWRDELPQAVALGGGDLRWLGLRIYRATLWAEQQPFQPALPFALQLSYYRSISRQRLVQTSMDEIRRLNRASIDDATFARWEAVLNNAFTDVVAGDQLIGVYAPGHGMRLYSQQSLLADIGDAQLARAFFAIWLDEATRDPGLRRQLLGDHP
jgi:hypothetical protein